MASAPACLADSPPTEPTRFRLSALHPLPVLEILTIIIAVVLAFRWTLKRDYFFYADDWTLLYSSAFYSYSELFSFLPGAIYNSRPLGDILIKLLFDLFGLNAVAFHFSLVTIHIFGTLLTYLVCARLFPHSLLRFLGALMFGTYYPMLVAVTWPAAVYDLLGHALVALSIVMFFIRKPFGVILSLAAYYAAMRTKEFGILVPFHLALFFLLIPKPVASRRQALSLLSPLWPHGLLLLLMALRYIYLFKRFWNDLSDLNNIYTMVITPSQLIQGLSFYLKSLFLVYYEGRPQLPPDALATILSVIFLLSIAVAAVGRKWLIVFGGAAFIIALLPVVFLKNHPHTLYLYDPSFFLVIYAVALAAFLRDLACRFLRIPAKISEAAFVIASAASLIFANRTLHKANQVKATLAGC